MQNNYCSIKILVESLKEVLTDINLYFDSNGLKIMTMDNARVALVYVRLLKDNFEEYFCNGKIMCGINMIYFFKILKTLSTTDFFPNIIFSFIILKSHHWGADTANNFTKNNDDPESHKSSIAWMHLIKIVEDFHESKNANIDEESKIKTQDRLSSKLIRDDVDLDESYFSRYI